MPSRSDFLLPLLLISTIWLAATHPTQAQNPEEIFNQAQRALAAGNYAKAEEGFHAVLKLDPRSAAAYDNLGVVYMRQARWDRALQALTEAKRLAPQVAGIDLNLGLAYYHKLEFEKAIPPFARVLQANPDNSQARYLLGMSYFMQDAYALAAQ